MSGCLALPAIGPCVFVSFILVYIVDLIHSSFMPFCLKKHCNKAAVVCLAIYNDKSLSDSLSHFCAFRPRWAVTINGHQPWHTHTYACTHMHHLNRWSGEMREEGRIALDNLVPIVCFWCCTHTNTQTQVRIPQLHPPSEASASHLLCI